MAANSGGRKPSKKKDAGAQTGIIEYARDITEQKRSQEALEKSEEQYRTLAEAAQDLIFIIDRDISIRYVNSYAAVQMGSQPGDLIGKRVEQIFPPSNYQRMKNDLLKVFQSGEALTVEDTITYPRSERWIETKLVPLKSATGEVEAVLGISRDFTEKKQSAAMLHESEERYRKLIEMSPDAVTLTDFDMNIIMANKKAALNSGFDSVQEIIGLNARDLIAPKYRQAVFENSSQHFAPGDIISNEFEALRKDGSTFIVDARSTLLTDANGKPQIILAISRDITERKLAEENIRKSEEIYRKLIETSPDAVTLTDFNMKIIMANKKAALNLGFDNEQELIGLNALDFVALKYRQTIIEYNSRIFIPGAIIEDEYEGLRKDGSTFTVDVRFTFLTDANGKPQSILAVTRDITERKLAEEKIRESEERYRHLVETSPDAIVLTGIDLKVTMANGQAALLYGVDHERELVGINVMDFIAPEDRQRAMESSLRTINTGHLALQEYQLLRKNGSSYPGEITASLLKDAKGNPIGFLGITRDITERKLREASLHESELRFRTLADSAQEAIFIHEEEKILEANQMAAEMTGFTVDELIGKSIWELVHPDFRDQSRGKITEGYDKVFESVGLKKDGSIHPTEVFVTRIPFKGRTVTVASVRDITSRKLVEIERRRLEEQLILSDRLASLGQLVLGIAHEFNNVLGGLRGYAQLSQMPGKENRLHELPDLVIEMVDRAQNVTENLLGFSERFHPAVTTVRPSELVQSILKLMRKDLEMGHIQVKMNIPEEFAFKTDGSKLQQVLLNITINARQAMPQGGTLSFDLKDESGKICLHVSDTGQGIPKESLSRVFDPFFTTKGPLGGGNIPGTGLGLSLSYGIMQSLGGAIEVESEIGHGSTFTIVLPATSQDK